MLYRLLQRRSYTVISLSLLFDWPASCPPPLVTCREGMTPASPEPCSTTSPLRLARQALLHLLHYGRRLGDDVLLVRLQLVVAPVVHVVEQDIHTLRGSSIIGRKSSVRL